MTLEEPTSVKQAVVVSDFIIPGLPHPGKVLGFFCCPGKSLNFVSPGKSLNFVGSIRKFYPCFAGTE